MRTAMASLALAIVLALAGSANAQITWNFQDNGPGDKGTSFGFASHTPSGYTMTLSAVSVSGAVLGGGTVTASSGGGDLFVKNQGGDENGVGLTSDTSGQHEITYGNGIVISLSGYTQPYSVSVGSVQSASHDVASVYKSTNGTTWTFVSDSSSDATISGITGALYLLVTEDNQRSTNPNVLLNTVTVAGAAVPEPSTMAIAGLGALGFIGYGLRRRKARTA